MELKGTIQTIDAIETFTSKAGKDYRKQFVVIEKTAGDRKKIVAFEARTDAAIKQVATFKEGDFVNVHYSLESREWNGNYYTTASIWKIEKYVPTAKVEQGDLPY